MSKFKSGFISIVGRPNVGKSTFINKILNRKVCIVTPKPQTTRNRIHGILTTKTEQIIFIDTPGIHKPKHLLGQYMNKESFQTFHDCDIILLMFDASISFGSGDEYVLNELKKVNTPIFLIANKIDLVKNKNSLIELVSKYQSYLEFKEIFYISSLNGDNIPLLKNTIVNYLEEGELYYPEDAISSSPENFIICEFIREKVLLLTKEEVPHSVAVVIENMKTNEDNPNLVDIYATIYVERASQKKIIIGKGGSMIKEIGTKARNDIVMLLGVKVYLELFVKVEENWRERGNQLRKLGYSSDV